MPSKIPSLSIVFDACRKAVFPTAEEKAEKIRQFQINNASLDLARAVRGVKIKPYDEHDMRASSFASGFIHGGVAHIPHRFEALDEAGKEECIFEASERLVKLGVSEDEIQAIISSSEEAMKNPKPTFLGYPEDF